MPDIVYHSRSRIARQTGPMRLASLPAEREPATFGAPGSPAAHYGVSPDVAEPHATTIDYVAAAAGG